MTDLFATPAMQLGLALTILVVVIATTFWLLGRLRDYTTQDQPGVLEGLSNLKEMHHKGDISEEEIRTIQASARAQLASSVSTDPPTTHSEAPTSELSDAGADESANPVIGEKQNDMQSTKP